MQNVFDEECTDDLISHCFKCQATLYPEQSFCGECGYKVGNVFVKAGVMRRMIAEIIDRIVPLPLIVYFFPPWIIVIALYGLLRESVFNSRSIGK